MPSTVFSTLKRRVAALFNPSSSSSSTSITNTTTITEQQAVDTAQTANKPNIPAGNPSPKRSKILKNLRLPWKKKSSNASPAQVFRQEVQDLVVAFQDSPQPVQVIHEPHYEHQHHLILSRRSSGISADTDRHSQWDAHSEFSIPSPRSPDFRYRMLYGPSIENIENMREAHQPNNDNEYDYHHRLLASEDEFVKELDKEMVGARPDFSSTASSTPSTPVSVVRCKTSRGTYDNSCPSPPTTPTSSRSILRCKTSRGTYDASGSSSPTTPTSTRSALSSSMPFRSSGVSQRFSSKVAPSSSRSRHASPKLSPSARLTSFSDVQGYQDPVMFIKEHIEHIQQIKSRLRILINSAPHFALGEPEQQPSLQQYPQNLKQQQAQQPSIVDHTVTSTSTQHCRKTVGEEPATSHQQRLRAKPSLIRRVDTEYDHGIRMQQRRRISAVDRTDCQSPTDLSHTVEPRSFSLHGWGLRWNYSAATAAGNLNLSSTTALTATAAAAVTRPSQHSNNNNFHSREPIERTRCLLEQVKERVASRMKLEAALWETEALLRQYETLVVQDWELKVGNFVNSTFTTAAANAAID
ncbi:hypothetical protein BGZ96_000144 [Linnemannia gamsii]|uniref:Uncharacterized protein n=1 Tax=Linnemannia gamsii TaxID=64522 RepID=A0ABQ7JPJ4_9FUNG|nr:hypothetical protein BGZ96_000144 [Linnemannia gamsii]